MPAAGLLVIPGGIEERPERRGARFFLALHTAYCFQKSEPGNSRTPEVVLFSREQSIAQGSLACVVSSTAVAAMWDT
jgi:hypothetical protein